MWLLVCVYVCVSAYIICMFVGIRMFHACAHIHTNTHLLLLFLLQSKTTVCVCSCMCVEVNAWEEFVFVWWSLICHFTFLCASNYCLHHRREKNKGSDPLLLLDRTWYKDFLNTCKVQAGKAWTTQVCVRNSILLKILPRSDILKSAAE